MLIRESEMRVGLPIAALILMMPTLVWGTTLRLSAEVDLLVLDGKRVSSSLLKGADSIEIDNGPHQLVLKLEKRFSPPPRGRFPGLSSPLIISFDTKEIDQVNIVLSPKDAVHPVTSPQIRLLDGHAQPVPVRTDSLNTKPESTGKDYEEETQRYNKSGKKASMPEFAVLKAGDEAQRFAAAQPDFPSAQPETLTEQRLKYWFSQADKPTRARFLRWANETPAP
jgi:uncharacterized protein YccT (UPF0319 family)